MQWSAYIRQTSRKIWSAIRNPVGLDRISAATNRTKSKYVGGQHSLPTTLTQVLGNVFPSCLISKLLRPSSDLGKSTERIYASDNSTPIYSTTRIRETRTSYRSFGRGNFQNMRSCNLKKHNKRELNKQSSGCLGNKLCRRWLRSGWSGSCPMTAFDNSVVETYFITNMKLQILPRSLTPV
jgi:hypothetical protein